MPTGKYSLDIFIPEDRRQALSRGETLPARSQGAVLFADLFGFTRLTRALSSELGPQRGAEELTRQLDPVYTRLFEAIHNYRGSVIGISGDGITCWFDQDDGKHAAACALQMQDILGKIGSIHIPGGAALDLGIKIAVLVGTVRRFLIGDPDIQLIEALAGNELDRVYAAQEQLDKGQVAVSYAVLEKIRPHVRVTAQLQIEDGGQFAIITGDPSFASPDPWPDIPPLNAEVARKWIFAPIYERIRDEELEFLTELRQAVPMFLKFNGIDYDTDERSGEKLDLFIRRVQAILQQYEGYLCQLTIGDKGSNLFIAFGAPYAHEDNIDRALSAALRLKQEIKNLGFIQSIQCGLTHGKVWAGAHGGRNARTYSVIGAEVNIANRLMSHATPDQILVSPHIVDMAQNYSFHQLAPIQLKGIEKPMAPSSLLGKSRPQNGPAEHNHILGREWERGILSQKLQDLLNSSESTPAGVLLIEGEAGIGKSRLLSDFMRQARLAGVDTLLGEADPVEKATQYYAVRPALEHIFDISENEDLETAREKVLGFIQPYPFLAERAPLLAEILPLRWPDNELTRQMSGEARATSLREVLLNILRIFIHRDDQRHPAILLFDDAQWLDSATWTLLNHLARELPELLLVLAMRILSRGEIGAQNEQELQRLRSLPQSKIIHLSSLSGDEITALVSQRLGVQYLPHTLLEFIRIRAQGNPFFSEEIALALRDAGIVRIAENSAAVVGVAAEDLNRLDFPDTVQGVVTSRIDRLAPSHQLTLKVASVIGRAFLLNILANIHPAKPAKPTLTGYLATLTQLGITEQEAITPELIYMFKHVITQEVVYSLLTFSQRKQLHCAIASWYEQTYSADLSPYYSRLAHHWLKGEEHSKAVFYLEKAAEQALDLFSNGDVIRYITTAMELDRREPSNDPLRNLQRARWERLLGIAHFRLGQLPEAQAHLARTLELLGRPMPKSPAHLNLALLAELLKQASHRIWPRQLQRQGSEAQRKIEEELARVEIESVHYYSQNNLLLAWGMLRRLNLAERVGMPALMAQGYSNLQMITGLAKLDKLSMRYRQLTQDALAKADLTSIQIFTLLREGVLHFINCHWEEANQDFEAGLQLADQLGDSRQWVELLGAYATCVFLQGDFEKCLNLWKGHTQRVLRNDDFQSQAWGYYGQGHSLLMLGNMEEALRLLQTSLAVPMKSADDKILDTSRYGALALAYYRHGDYDKTLDTILKHQKLAPAAPAVSSTIVEYETIFDATLCLWSKVRSGEYRPNQVQMAQLEQAFHRIPRLTKLLKVSPVNAAKAWLFEGLYHDLLGAQSRALAAWKKCLDLAGERNQPLELARAHFELGRSLPAHDPARGHHLEQACQIFERLKTTPNLERVLALLRS